MATLRSRLLIHRKPYKQTNQYYTQMIIMKVTTINEGHAILVTQNMDSIDIVTVLSIEGCGYVMAMTDIECDNKVYYDLGSIFM